MKSIEQKREGRALHKLTLVQLYDQRPLSDLEQQGFSQVFEFNHELAWNVLKDYLEEAEMVDIEKVAPLAKKFVEKAADTVATLSIV